MICDECKEDFEAGEFNDHVQEYHGDKKDYELELDYKEDRD